LFKKYNKFNWLLDFLCSECVEVDTKVLLGPFEDQLDLPAAFVKRADGCRGKII
jgi:hypothetical protein